MINTATTTHPTLGVGAEGFDLARATLKPLFDGQEHWIVVCDFPASQLLLKIAEKYYADCEESDARLVTVFCGREMFNVAALRKRLMLAHQYQSLLRQVARLNTTEREIVSRDVLICTQSRRLDQAAALAEDLFGDPDAARFPAGELQACDGGLSMAT